MNWNWFVVLRMKAVTISLLVLSIGFSCFCNALGYCVRERPAMKWSFAAGMGSLRELGLIGSEGEYYFHPTKRASLVDVPLGTTRKTTTIPIFFWTNVLTPGSTDWLNIFEMKHRQLFNDVDDDGVVGFTHFSQTNQKVSLVGTLARVKERKMLSDGRAFLVVQGLRRYYLQEFTREKPYPRARVQSFMDYSVDTGKMELLERELLQIVRLNVRLMAMLSPTKNYTLSEGIRQYKPRFNLTPLHLKEGMSGVRRVAMDETTAAKEIQRASSFSFAVLEMLQVTPATKLALMQEMVVERRLAKLIKIIATSSVYLRKEIVSKGILSENEITRLQQEMQFDYSDLEAPTAWVAENFVQGDWIQRPVLM